MECSQERQTSCLDFGYRLGVLWRRARRRYSGLRKGHVRRQPYSFLIPNLWCSVKLLTGSLSHQNPGNQFGHAAPIFTVILLAITAVLQIICLNKGLKVYDSTLVVPVFYGVYTATGWVIHEETFCSIKSYSVLPCSFLNALVSLHPSNLLQELIVLKDL